MRASVLAMLLGVGMVSAADPKTDAERLNGVWLFDGYRMAGGSRLGEVWTSVVTVADGKFSITKVYDSDKPFTGTLTVDEAKKAIDFKIDGFDLTPLGMPLKLTPATIPALYKLDGDTLTLALEFDLEGKRPTEFATIKKRDAILALRRAPKDFKAFPAEVTVKAVGPDDRPAAGVVVGGYMQLQKELELTDAKGEKFVVNPAKTTPDELKAILARLPDNKEMKAFVTTMVTPPPGVVRDPDTGWSLHDAKTAGADGTAKIKFEDLRFATVIVRDPAKKLMAIAGLSPWRLRTGEVVVKLQPECRVTVTGTCDEISKNGGKLQDAFNSYAQTADGQRIAYSGSKDGKLEYLLPPGEYELDVYGSEAMGRKGAKLTVPKDQSEYAAPPIDLPATGLHKLIGKPAPELTDVVAWKGEAVTLADLKGKVVLLEFWGYWCGPCIQSIPVLFELHDTFKDKGLVIVGVHVDADGEVDSAKALDDKIKGYKKEVWKDRDLPFPSALVNGKGQESGARGKLADTYGIRSYPSTVLIDRDGKVVGKFHARDAKSAVAEMERILKAEKK